LPRTAFFSEPSIVSEARQVLAGMGATVAKTAIAQRVALSHAIISGSTVAEFEPTGKAAAEIEALWLEIQKTLGA
jgi:chromosome partitioning protein